MTNEEMMDKIKILRANAMEMDFKFDRGEYEWELGQIPIKMLTEFCVSPPIIHHGLEVEYSTSMGIPIRYNYVDPEMIKLWRNVK